MTMGCHEKKNKRKEKPEYVYMDIEINKNLRQFKTGVILVRESKWTIS